MIQKLGQPAPQLLGEFVPSAYQPIPTAVARRYLLLLFFWLLTFPMLRAQNASDAPNRWWLGFKFGTNLTQVRVGDQFTAFSGSANENEKTYENPTALGVHVGLVGVFDVWNGFSVSLQPTWQRARFGYITEYSWADASGALSLKYTHDHALTSLEIPLLIRYEYQGFGKLGKKNKKGGAPSRGSKGGGSDRKGNLIPYLQAGGSYGRLLEARKTIETEGSENGLGFTEGPRDFGVTDQFNRWYYAVLLGGGVTYDVGESARFGLDVQYRLGLVARTNQKNRHANNELTAGYYDAFDDMRFSNWLISVHALFPLKFVYSPQYRKAN